MNNPRTWLTREYLWYQRNPDLLERHHRMSRNVFYIGVTGFIVVGVVQALLFKSAGSFTLLRDVGSHTLGLCTILAVTLGAAINWLRLEVYGLLSWQSDQAPAATDPVVRQAMVEALTSRLQQAGLNQWVRQLQLAQGDEALLIQKLQHLRDSRAVADTELAQWVEALLGTMPPRRG